MNKDDRTELAAHVITLLQLRQAKIVVAESLTGGMLADSFVRIPGVSAVFDAGFVCYSHHAKQRILKVSEDLLQRPGGAVQAEVAEAMALGSLKAAGFERGGVRGEAYAVSTTGVAGPDPSDGVPVGTVFVGFSDGIATQSQMFQFQGDRLSIREQTVIAVLNMVVDVLDS